MNLFLLLLATIATLAALLMGLHAWRVTVRTGRLAGAKETAERILEKADNDARARLEAASLEAKLRLEAAEARLEEESQQRVRDLEEKRQEIERRDKDLRYRVAFAEEKVREAEKREAAVSAVEQAAARLKEEAAALAAQQRSKLEQIAGLTAREAKEQLRRELEAEARREAAAAITRAQEEARERAAEEARWVVTQAIQRVPLSQYAETTVTVVSLPSDEMKGRIIGREGRNIRAIEMSCGIDLIIDDTPQAIILSSFDPTRRTIARLAIERLVEDGRIHPARIEEVVHKTREDFDRITAEQGEAAAFELALHDLNPRLFRLAGRLAYLTYHGQNLLEHSREVAVIAAHMAGLLGARAEVARRAGFLHKVGFADETNRDRSPLVLSADLVQRLGEGEAVIHCIQALYGIVAPRTVEAVLLAAAETASTSRPGAQKEMLQEYLERLRRLEEIAASFKGVREAYALRAGKEVRVIVSSDEIGDKETVWLSRDIAGRIEREVDYPGQLRVSVIRETRAVDFAM